MYALIMILAAGIIFFRASGPVLLMREGLVRIAEPLAHGASAAGRWLARRDEASDMISAHQELEADRILIERLTQENQSLQKALGFKTEINSALKGARVVSFIRELGAESLIVDQGQSDGLKKGDIAVDEYGFLVGEVVEAGNGHAQIAVASNPPASFPAALLPLGVSVLAKGMGSRTFSVRLVPAEAPIRRGDFLMRLVSGIVGSRHTIPAGIVTDDSPPGQSAFKELHAALLARPEMLERVFLISLPAVSGASDGVGGLKSH